MRTLEEIKNDVCLEYGYYTYSIAVSDFKNGRMCTKTFNCIVRDIAKEVAKEALNNASENVKMKEGDRRPPLGSFDYIVTHYTVVDKQSILNESNIPEL